MSVVISVVAAFAAIVAISRWQNYSAHALGKVSAVVSATAVIAEAWSKTHVIAKKLRDNPTAVSLPLARSAEPAPASSALVPREPHPEDDFLNENPSFRTGGLRGYSAYAHRP